MNEPLPEDDLHALFERQRAADHEHAPGFHAMRARALASAKSSRLRPVAWPWTLAGSAAAAIALAAMIFLNPPAKPRLAPRDTVIRELDQIDAALQKTLAAREDLTAWQSPTDFLLNSSNNKSTQ
jgi:hypothetical protein